jgi:hypothetical protein
MNLRPSEPDVCPECEQEECECLTPEDIAYLKAQAIWDDLGLGGL